VRVGGPSTKGARDLKRRRVQKPADIRQERVEEAAGVIAGFRRYGWAGVEDVANEPGRGGFSTVQQPSSPVWDCCLDARTVWSLAPMRVQPHPKHSPARVPPTREATN
jgi:hypothetical protein